LDLIWKNYMITKMILSIVDEKQKIINIIRI